MSPMNLSYTFTASRLFIAAVELTTPMIFLTVPPHTQHVGSSRSSRSFHTKTIDFLTVLAHWQSSRRCS